MFVADTLIVVGLATVSLGTIQESDGVREQRFLLRNDGQETVDLMQGYTSCGCTTIHFDKARQLMPGDTTSVTLRFNPRGKGGEFEETGTIEYGSEQLLTATKRPKRVSLSLTGNCITSEETLMRQFPIRVDDRLRLSTDRFDLGRMRVGQTKERTVVILHTQEANRKEMLTLRFTAEGDKRGLQHIPYSLIVHDGAAQKEIIIMLDVFIN